jgi:glycogen synthase
MENIYFSPYLEMKYQQIYYWQSLSAAQGGHGLQDTLKLHSNKFVGILNGIDTDTWNPSADRFLKVRYSANDLHGKSANKAALRKQLKLSTAYASQPLVCFPYPLDIYKRSFVQADLVIDLIIFLSSRLTREVSFLLQVGCITRLVPHKGVHLIRHAIYKIAELGGQFVLLGSSPVPHIQVCFLDQVFIQLNLVVHEWRSKENHPSCPHKQSIKTMKRAQLIPWNDVVFFLLRSCLLVVINIFLPEGY